MTISPWWLLASAVPCFLLGEFLVRRVRWLAKFDVPAPRVMLIVRIVGAFLIDLTNALTITVYLNLLK